MTPPGGELAMSCNRIASPCGCATWDEWRGGAWVRMSCSCLRHEETPR